MVEVPSIGIMRYLHNQRYTLNLLFNVKLSPDNRVGLPGCITSKCGSAKLSEFPKGNEQYFTFILHLSRRKISKLHTVFIYRAHSLTAEMQVPEASMTAIPQHNSS